MRPRFHTFRVFLWSCEKPFDKILLSFTNPIRTPFLRQSIFTCPGSSLCFATIIIANLGDTPFLVKIYFHIFNAFRRFCDNRLWRVSHILRKPYLLWNCVVTDPASSLHSVKIWFWPVSQIRPCLYVLRQSANWVSLGASDLAVCDRMLSPETPVLMICDKNSLKFKNLPFLKLIFVTHRLFLTLLWKCFEKLSQSIKITMNCDNPWDGCPWAKFWAFKNNGREPEYTIIMG